MQQVLELSIEFAIEFRKTKSKSSLTQLNYNLQVSFIFVFVIWVFIFISKHFFIADLYIITVFCNKYAKLLNLGD